MTLDAALGSLDAAIAGLRRGVRGDALLAPVAADCLGMVRAYRADAGGFAGGGDLVNALAAIAYAAGWLDAAITVGLLDGEASGVGLLTGIVRDGDAPRLGEKARRYTAMLAAAVEAAAPAPDPASPAYAAGAALIAAAEALLVPSTAYLADGELEASLSASSYAYGWLDAGVRAGLVAIAGDRSLFAV